MKRKRPSGRNHGVVGIVELNGKDIGSRKGNLIGNIELEPGIPAVGMDPQGPPIEPDIGDLHGAFELDGDLPGVLCRCGYGKIFAVPGDALIAAGSPTGAGRSSSARDRRRTPNGEYSRFATSVTGKRYRRETEPVGVPL